MSKNSFKNQLVECNLIPRKLGDVLFTINKNNEILCDLCRYTILPNEQYEKLIHQSEINREDSQ
ncbi:MAG: hypothetical protein SVO01_08885 [Thermotogota bacterium]|nr:hypothetical protein [Thermotogota bacterium]